MRFLPHTQTLLSSLHQLEQGRGSLSLHSNPGPLYEVNDSCQGRQTEEERKGKTDRQGGRETERGGELGVRRILFLSFFHMRSIPLNDRISLLLSLLESEE